MKLNFQYPPKELLPNKKASWQTQMMITKQVRRDSGLTGLAQSWNPDKIGTLSHCSLVITWYPSDKRRIADFDSQLRASKPILDSLVDAGFILDDSPAVIKSVTLRYGEPDKAHPRTEIEIKEAK